MAFKLLNLAMFALMIVMNYLANAIPLNGKTTGELSDQYPNLFVPAGITFSIWGVIYLLLLLVIILQFRTAYLPVITSLGIAFALSSLLNAGWIMAWHYEKLPLSLIIMLGILASLVYINFQLHKGGPLIFKIAFGIYLGWILIATLANLTALLVHYNWIGVGISDQTWAIIMIGAGTLASALVLIKLNNPFLALSVIWAFIGIIIKRNDDFTSIVITAVAGIIIISLVMIWEFRRLFTHGA